MSVLGLVIVIPILALAACGKPAGRLSSMAHPNGLLLAMPDSIELGVMRKIAIEQTTTGFKVQPADQGMVRYVTEATVERRDGDSAPAGEWPEKRTIDGRTVHYRIDRSDGGSGGAEYNFQAWERVAVGYIFYRQYDQAEEPAPPRFDLIWSVIEGTGVSEATR